MAINFPTSPIDGQLFTSGQITWVYVSAKSVWQIDIAGTLAAHTHPESEIVGLVADLAAKAAASHTHPAADISDSTAAGRAMLLAADAAAQAALLGIVGKQTIWIPAGALLGAGTFIDVRVFDVGNIRAMTFDPSTTEVAALMIAMPKNWDEGNVYFQPWWTHPATATNFGVAWSFQAAAMSDNELIDVTTGGGTQVTDTGGTTLRAYKAPLTAAITITGTPSEGDIVTIRVYRNTADGADNMAVDAYLLGFYMHYTTNALNDN